MSKLHNDVKQSEARYSNLINSILDILIEINLDLTITYVNFQVYDLLGYSSEELIGKRFTSFIHLEDTQRIIEIINKTIKKEDNFLTELKMKKKKGYYILFSVNGRLVEYNNHPKIVMLLRDLSQLKDAQQKLMESDKKYREIIENIEDGYFEVDLEGNYTYVNDYTCRYLGFSREEILEKNYTFFVDKKTTKEMYLKSLIMYIKINFQKVRLKVK